MFGQNMLMRLYKSFVPLHQHIIIIIDKEIITSATTTPKKKWVTERKKERKKETYLPTLCVYKRERERERESGLREANQILVG
jgi:hypothetical protein